MADGSADEFGSRSGDDREDGGVSDDLLDRDHGPQNGQLVDTVIAARGSVDNAPCAESWESVLTRAQSALAKATTRATNGPVVLVSHDAVNYGCWRFSTQTLARPQCSTTTPGGLNVLRRANSTWLCWSLDGGRDHPVTQMDSITAVLSITPGRDRQM